MDQSSDSDEESVRHDRFRSERFQVQSNKESRARGEARNRYSDDRNNRKRRESSPMRNHHRRHDTRSPPPSRRRERSNHERKSRERDSRESGQKSSSSNPDEWAKFSRKMADKQNSKNKDTPNKKKCLSSLLKSFDDKVDAKRQLENVIGPVLPSHMAKEAVDSSVGSSDTDPFDNSDFHAASKESKDGDVFTISKQLEDVINDTSQLPQPQEESEKLEGPALPPHLLQKRETLESPTKLHFSPNSSADLGNEIQQNNLPIPGPALSQDEKTEAYGPSLPPKVTADSYGPALPPSLKKSLVQGPSLPEGLSLEELQDVNANEEEDDDDETVGPLPDGKMTATQFQLELRAAQIKQQLEDEKNGSGKEVTQREEWMLELPSGKAANLGLGQRSFRKREAPDMSDRSSWTDTPADRRRKEELAARGETELNPADTEEEMRLAVVKQRDAAMEEMSHRDREDDRPKSLLEMHQKKLNKKKKKQEKEEQEGKKKKERRPFDRNVDLQVNRFDDAQKRVIFKKAQLLDTRFSSGESKYL